MEPLRIILSFTLLIGPLVFLHELGHLLAARKFGVYCYEFSLGFGPRIASIQGKETVYSFRALPFGGYVRVLGMHDGDEGIEGMEGRSLQDTKRWQRLIFHLAGPLMNLLIPIPIFLAFHLGSPEYVPAVVGSVEVGMPADNAGLVAGDRIIGIDGKNVRSFNRLQTIVSRNAGQQLDIRYERAGEVYQTTLTPEATRSRDPMLPFRIVEKGLIGVHQRAYAPVIHVDPGSVASRAGMRTFDRIQRIGDEDVSSYYEAEQALRQASNGTRVVLLRPSTTSAPYGTLDMLQPVTLTLAGPVGAGDDAGLHSAQRTIVHVDEGSPADITGLQRGDRVETINGEAFTDVRHALARLTVDEGQEYTVTWQRGTERLSGSIAPVTMRISAEMNTERDETFIGATSYSAFAPAELERRSLIPHILRSILDALLNTISIIGSLVLGVFHLFTGKVDSGSLGGPLMIADAASQAARIGWERFITMMALISINLGVLNLVPIPGLDGGNIAVLGLESIKRGPLSPRAQQLIQFIGVAFIIILMIFVFKNDIERYWSRIANWLNS